jgi:hypothetical protein
MTEAAYGSDHPEVAAILGNLGIVLVGLEQLPQARALLGRSLAILEVAYGPDHLQVARALAKGSPRDKLDWGCGYAAAGRTV